MANDKKLLNLDIIRGLSLLQHAGKLFRHEHNLQLWLDYFRNTYHKFIQFNINKTTVQTITRFQMT